MKNKKYESKYIQRDNNKFISKFEYKPEVITERKLNPETEKYEYKEHTINLKLEQENKQELMQDLTIENVIRRVNR